MIRSGADPVKRKAIIMALLAIVVVGNAVLLQMPRSLVILAGVIAAVLTLNALAKVLRSLPTANSFKQQDKDWAASMRSGGMDPRVLELSMKTRHAQRELGMIDAQLYDNTEANFSFKIPATWASTPLLPVFRQSGGRLALVHDSRQATLNVSVGGLERPTHKDRETRKAELERVIATAGYSHSTVDTPTGIWGEANVVRGHWHERDGSEAGLVSIFRNDREYVIQWKADRERANHAAALAEHLRFT